MKANEIKHAVVLAAGLGERLRPLTCVKPKPLLPLWGVPLLERILSLLESWGVEEIVVNAHWRAEDIQRYCALRRGVAKITVSTEKDILGTGGALNPIRYFVSSAPFWLVNGDIVIEALQAQPLVDAFEKSHQFASCWITEEAGPRTLEVDPDGHVCNWASDVPQDPGTWTYCGCALLSPQILNYIEPTGFSTIVQAYVRALYEDGLIVRGVQVPGSYWADCGTLEGYLEAHHAFYPERFEANPNVLFEGVKLLDSADLAGCVVTGGLVGGSFERTILVGVNQIHHPQLSVVTKELGWNEDDTAAAFLGTRGSARSFWRLVCGDAHALAIPYEDAARPENARYAALTTYLTTLKIPVPHLLADVPEKKILALEDIPCGSLQTRACEKGASLIKLYAPVVDAMRRAHETIPSAYLESHASEFEPPFDETLYAWERDLFEAFVKTRYPLEGVPCAVRTELESVAACLLKEPRVALHRDLQSSNVLYRADGSFVFIDYQGMRLGPAVYDLASLLYDPYVPLDEKERKALAARDALENLPMGAVQRLIQTLGAFGRLSSVGQPQFTRYIPQGLTNLLAAADEANLDALGGFVEDLLAFEEMRCGHFHPHHHAHEA